MIELLTVIAIIGILAAIIIPVVGKVRMSAKKAADVSNLRQSASAWLMYFNDNKNRIQTLTPGVPIGYNPGQVHLGQSLYLGAPDRLAHGDSEVSPIAMGPEFKTKFAITTAKNKAYYKTVSYWHNVHVWNASSHSNNLYSKSDLHGEKFGPLTSSRTAMLGVVEAGELLKGNGQVYLWEWSPARFEAYGGSSTPLAFFDGHVETIGVDKLPDRWAGGQ